MNKIRVIVADRHEIFRQGLCCLLSHQVAVGCIAQADDGELAVDLATRLQPDIVTIDIDMPTINGIEAAKRIKSLCTATHVIILTHFRYRGYVTASISAGIDGYLLKNNSVDGLVSAMRTVFAGNSVLDLQLTSGMLQIADAVTLGRDRIKLREREIEVLMLLADGMSNKQIAVALNISAHTVATHLINVFRKLGVQSRTEAMRYVLRMVPLPD